MSAAVPTLPDRQGVTQFVTIGGTMLALPASARLDLAYQWTYFPADVVAPLNGALAQTIVVGGTVFEIPLNFNTQLSTTSTVKNRLPLFFVNSPTTSFTGIPASAAQTASLTGLFDFNISTSGAYSVTATTVFAVAGIPPFVVWPGWSYGVEIAGGAVQGDALRFAAVISLRIPTGPGVTPPGPTATPVLT